MITGMLEANGSGVDAVGGEVTSGYHEGNRLGGNAITEIIVSDRETAKSVTKDNK